MLDKILKALSQCLLCSCLVALFACGKEAKKSEPKPDKVAPPIEEDFEAYLQKQTITCSETSTCPSYIAKIIVRHGPGNYKTCTGFLTDADTIATSTTCLPEVLRLSGIDCNKDVAFYFYERFSKGLRVGCKVVVQASEDHFKDPNLNRDDVAFLKLASPLPYRRTLRISREGMGVNKFTTIVGVEQSDELNGEIKELDCPSVTGSYINPLVTNDASPGFTLAGCAFAEGFTGAPVIDSRNRLRVRGVVSAGMDPKIKSYLLSTGLLTNGLKDFIHGSNFACSPTIYDNNVADEKECNKELTTLQIERLRSNMLSSASLFTEFKTKLETSLENNTRYVRFNLKLVPQVNPADPSKPNYDIQNVEITPKCFKDVDYMSNSKYQEISRFKKPRRTFRKSMDDVGRVQSSEVDNGALTVSMSWNPKELKKNKSATLYVWDPNTEANVEPPVTLPVCP